VLECANTPELQQRSLQYVRWGAEMRFAYTRALYDTYVAPDLGDSMAGSEVTVEELLGSA
jgi:pyrroloquinoline-quinone synthase